MSQQGIAMSLWQNLGVAQLVARCFGVTEVARSSRVTQTKVENVCLQASPLFCFLFALIAFNFFGQCHAMMYAPHTKSCLLLGGRTRRALRNVSLRPRLDKAFA